MKHKNLALSLGGIILGSLILLISCKKINDYTTLGGDLIPEVDGINTFDTIIDIRAFNDTFSKITDTTYNNTGNSFFLGHIENDPLFGKTDARISLELKPSSYRYSFSNRPDSLHIDSVVLVLDYVETYGDTNAVQTVNVYEINNNYEFRSDTGYNIREYAQQRAGLLGSRSFQPKVLNDSVRAYKDTSANQLRIRLNDAFGSRLLAYDTTTAGGRVAAYRDDSSFQRAFRGFTIESVSGNAIMGFNLEGANTKLAIYYKDDHNDAGSVPTPLWDTAVAYFTFAGNAGSAAAQNIVRDHTGTQLAALSNGTTGTPDNELYIQSAPGSFATLKIPGLVGIRNRIVHRAEIMIDQIYSGISDSLFYPTNMYIDAYDPGMSAFMTIPYDVTFDASGNANLSAFGVVPRPIKDQFGNPIRQWRFNVTRYVQNVLNGNTPAFDLRLTMPLYIQEQYKSNPLATPFAVTVPVNTAPGKGRVRLHGSGDGSVPGADPQRIRLRIVYSEL